MKIWHNNYHYWFSKAEIDRSSVPCTGDWKSCNWFSRYQETTTAQSLSIPNCWSSQYGQCIFFYIFNYKCL